MKDAIVHATPRSLAIVGATPFAIAVVALSTRSTSGPPVLFAAAVLAGVALVLVWSWVIGHALNARIDVSRRPKRGPFRVALVFSAAYGAAFLGNGIGGVEPFVSFPMALFALHAIAVVAMLEVLHFIGINLDLAEADENASPAGSAWTTTLALFSIGGILPVQARVNRLFAKD